MSEISDGSAPVQKILVITQAEENEIPINNNNTNIQPFFVKTFNEEGQLTINVVQPFHCSINPLEMYSCTKCPFKTQLFLSLNKHINQVHRNSNFPCHYFQYHSCGNCDFKTYSRLSLLRHASKYHFFQYKTSKYKEIRWWECERCCYIHPLVSLMKKHIFAKHVDENNLKWFRHMMCPMDLRMAEQAKWLQCDQCDFRSKGKNFLKHHVWLQHTVAKVKLWHCDYCPVKVKDLHELRTHVWGDHNRMFKSKPEQFR